MHRNYHKEWDKIRRQKYVPNKGTRQNPDKLNTVDISNPSDKMFMVMIIKMLNELGSRMSEHSEDFNRIEI